MYICMFSLKMQSVVDTEATTTPEPPKKSKRTSIARCCCKTQWNLWTPKAKEHLYRLCRQCSLLPRRTKEKLLYTSVSQRFPGTLITDQLCLSGSTPMLTRTSMAKTLHQNVSGLMTIKSSKKVEWQERIDTIKQEIQHFIDEPHPRKT